MSDTIKIVTGIYIGVGPIDCGKQFIIVKRFTLSDANIVRVKHALSVDGEWIEVKETEEYPDECRLPVGISFGSNIAHEKLRGIRRLLGDEPHIFDDFGLGVYVSLEDVRQAQLDLEMMTW